MSSQITYEFSILQESTDSVFKVSLRPPQRQIQNAFDEAVLAARLIAEKYTDRKIILFLECNYESAATLQAFLKSGAPFEVARLNFKSLPLDSNDWLSMVCRKQTIPLHEIIFDFTNERHRTELDHIAHEIQCNDLRVITNLWATCQVDDIPVRPGYFTFPIYPLKTAEFRYNLPGPSDKKYLDFFNQFDGEPFFLGSTSELAHAFLNTTFAREVYTYYLDEQDVIEFNPQAKKILIQDAGFDLQDSPPEPYQTFSVQRLTSSLKSADLTKYIGHKNEKYSIESPPQKIVNEIDFEIVKVSSLRPQTRQLIQSYTGAGFEYNTNQTPTTIGSTSFALFPKLLTVQNYRGDLRAVVNLIENQPFYFNFGNLISAKNLHEQPELSELTRFFHEALLDYVKKMHYVIESIEITQCWATKTSYGQSHHKHQHPNSFLSGVFYLTSGGGGNITFHEDQYQAMMPQLEETNSFNTGQFQIKPRQGLLIIFPSSLTHSTQVSLTDQTRYSIAFNAMVRGQLGSWEAAAWAQY